MWPHSILAFGAIRVLKLLIDDFRHVIQLLMTMKRATHIMKISMKFKQIRANSILLTVFIQEGTFGRGLGVF
jgi:hypothetical protein